MRFSVSLSSRLRGLDANAADGVGWGGGKVHWRYYNTELAREFWLLVECLDDMSKRWAGTVGGLETGSDLAAKYSSQLRALHCRCNENADFSLDALGYATDGFPDQTARHSPKESHGNGDPGCNGAPEAASLCAGPGSDLQPLTATPAASQRPLPAVQLGPMLQTPSASRHLEKHSQDELSAISTALMDQDFVQLDRVISFDDMSFTVQTDNGNTPSLAGGGWNFG